LIDSFIHIDHLRSAASRKLGLLASVAPVLQYTMSAMVTQFEAD